MKKVILVSPFIFLLGFFVHAYIFPDLFSQSGGLDNAKNKVLGQKEEKSEQEKSLTISSYKNGSFHPSKIWMKKGYYVGIQNEDEEKLMWLESENPDLSTVRGYGFGEQLRILLSKEGSYIVNEKESGTSLVIVVQP